MLSLYAIATRGQDKIQTKVYKNIIIFFYAFFHTIINYIMNMDAQKRIQKYHIKLHFNCIKRVHKIKIIFTYD